MRASGTLFLLAAASLSAAAWPQQPSAPPGSAASSTSAGAPPTATSILQPALEQLRSALDTIRLAKWKAPGPVREDASSNIGSIRNDLDATLPPMLTAADASPGDLVKAFPVYRNIDALYDVVLRVSDTASLAAPDDQAQSLQTALGALDDARRNLGEAIENAAIAHASEAAALQAQLKQAQAATSASTETSEPATHHRRKKPAANTTTPQ